MKIFVQVEDGEVAGWAEVDPYPHPIDWELAYRAAKMHCEEVKGRVKELADMIESQAVQSFGTD